MIHDRLVLTDQAVGKKRSRTPEGFLLCEDVPIARTGIQDYLNEELVDEDEHDTKLSDARGKDGIIKAHRSAEDLFKPEVFASFEGKDVVDDHPDDQVGPDNYKQHTVGVVLNPHRGEGHLSDCIVADLLIKDADAIQAVEDGKVEVSCGYDADYDPIGAGKVRQYNFVGNHVALVDRGRCGSKCSIGDQAMPKKVTLMDRIYAAIKSKDAKGLDAALKDAEGIPGMNEEGVQPNNDDEPNDAKGVHIHIHGANEGGTASSDAPNNEEDAGADEPKSIEDRMTAMEQSVSTIADAVRKLAGAGGAAEEEVDSDEEDVDADSEGNEEEDDDEAEAESDPTLDADYKEGEEGALTVKDEDEPNEEGTSEEISDEDMEMNDRKKTGDKKTSDKKKTGDKKTVFKDSVHLKNGFASILSGAEILAPGIKLPTFDAKAKPKATIDTIGLLRKRALVKMSSNEEGADILKALTGSKKLDGGLTNDALGIIFNGAVALMKDKNDITKVKPVASLFGRTKDTNKALYANVKSPADFNAANRERYGQKTNH